MAKKRLGHVSAEKKREKEEMETGGVGKEDEGESDKKEWKREECQGRE